MLFRRPARSTPRTYLLHRPYFKQVLQWVVVFHLHAITAALLVPLTTCLFPNRRQCRITHGEYTVLGVEIGQVRLRETSGSKVETVNVDRIDARVVKADVKIAQALKLMDWARQHNEKYDALRKKTGPP